VQQPWKKNQKKNRKKKLLAEHVDLEQENGESVALVEK
jgi:hypothetical protein